MKLLEAISQEEAAQTQGPGEPPHDSHKDRGHEEHPGDRHPESPGPATSQPSGWRDWLFSTRLLVIMAMVIGGISHGYNMFAYPVYITDEGIYMEQAWSVIREGRLSPYTYYYDHAPAGWLMIAAWIRLLPFQFGTFGNAIDTGRVLMLMVHVANVFLLFFVTYRLSHSKMAAFIATFLFNLSPLAVFYQREVVLDNIMVLWILLGLYLATSQNRGIIVPMASGLCLGVASLTKENAIFFAPVVIYLVYHQVRSRPNYRFALGFWTFSFAASISFYFLYATLKNELFPTGFDFDPNNPPADHVSLLYTLWWQLHRNQGSIFDPNSLSYQFSVGRWVPKDAFILAAGAAAMIINLIIGLADRSRYRGYLAASVLALGYAFYLVRGSVILDFYIVPLMPFLAMNIGILFAHLARRLPQFGRGTALTVFFGMLLLHPTWGYVLVIDEFGKVVTHDLYKLDLTYLQDQQVDFIRHNIPSNARIVTDDDIWVQLHDVRPYYRFAHSHWKVSSDPDVRDKLFAKNWQNIDYIVMSNQMLITMQQNNTDGSYNWILEALNHAKLIWVGERPNGGGVRLEIYQIQK